MTSWGRVGVLEGPKTPDKIYEQPLKKKFNFVIVFINADALITNSSLLVPYPKDIQVICRPPPPLLSQLVDNGKTLTNLYKFQTGWSG